jgi:peptidyl-prolyl cis-trans isomerase SurA
MMRITGWLLAMVLCIAVCAFAEQRFSNGIAAIANDSIITWQEVRQESADALELYERTFYNRPNELEQKRLAAMTEALDRLIDRQLVLQEFKTLGGVIQDSYIDDSIRDKIRERYGDRVTLTKTLMAQGINQETFRQRTRDEIIFSIMRRKNITESLLISPAKIEHNYETNLPTYKLGDQIKLRMLVINRTATVEDSFRLVSEIRTKIEGGASFGEMAVLYSEGPYKKDGGLWGLVGEKKLLKGLSEIAFNLPTGKCSQVVCRAAAGDEGYWIYQYNPAGKVTVARKYTEPHVFLEEKTFPKGADLEDLPALPAEFYLMLVEEKQSARTRPLEEVRDEIERDLLVQERARLEKKWIERLRSKAFVRSF